MRDCPLPVRPTPDEVPALLRTFPSIHITRSFSTRIINLSVQPVLILAPPHYRAYILLNPTATTIYLGNRTVNPDNGYPLFQEQREILTVDDDVELWAMAGVATTIKVFTL